MESITKEKNPLLDEKVSNEKLIDDDLDRITILGSIQTLQNYRKVSIRNDVYKVTISGRKQITDTAIIKNPNQS